MSTRQKQPQYTNIVKPRSPQAAFLGGVLSLLFATLLLGTLIWANIEVWGAIF